MSQPVAISDCVNDLELHNFIEESNFSKALNTCESLESGTLAVPIDEDILPKNARLEEFWRCK